MRTVRVLIVALPLSLSSATWCAAQDSAFLRTGLDVIAWTRNQPVITGRVLSGNAKHLLLATSRGPVSIERDSLDLLERRSQRSHGMAITGAVVIGGPITALGFLAAGLGCPANDSNCASSTIMAAAAVGTVGGALLGHTIGAMLPKWRKVATNSEFVAQSVSCFGEPHVMLHGGVTGLASGANASISTSFLCEPDVTSGFEAGVITGAKITANGHGLRSNGGLRYLSMTAERSMSTSGALDTRFVTSFGAYEWPAVHDDDNRKEAMHGGGIGVGASSRFALPLGLLGRLETRTHIILLNRIGFALHPVTVISAGLGRR